MNTNITTQQASNAIAVTALYKVAFDRLPDADGLAYWLNSMENGQTLRDVARGFSTHLPQFSSATPTQNVVDLFMQNAVDHNASIDTVSHWGILAINAVPSYELAYELTLKLIGQATDPWAGALT